LFSVWFSEFEDWNLFGNWFVEIFSPGSAGILQSTVDAPLGRRNNLPLAYQAFLAAATEGQADSQFNLALMYEKGIGTGDDSPSPILRLVHRIAPELLAKPGNLP
jgi:hypothetical protein